MLAQAAIRSSRGTKPWLSWTRARRKSTVPYLRARTIDSARQSRPEFSPSASPLPSSSSPPLSAASLFSSPHHQTRSLSTWTEAIPPTPSLPYDPFASSWTSQAQLSKWQRLGEWHVNPLIIRDTMAVSPILRRHAGAGAEPIEMHQNLYACLRVGRLDRAAFLLERLTLVYSPSAPELVDAHNVYLHALFELAQQDPQDDSLAEIELWYDKYMASQGIQPTAQTFVTLVRAAMNFQDGPSMEKAVRKFLAMALQRGPQLVEAVNASSDFSDEEWETLIRLQPEAFAEPPTVQELHELHVSSPDGRQNLIEYGLVSHPTQVIKPVPQKGFGLDSLKQALTALDEAEPNLPPAGSIGSTQEERDQAHAYARQISIERTSADAALARWKLEDEKLKQVGIHGVLQSKPIQAIMYSWCSVLEPLFQKRIEHVRQILSAPYKDNIHDDSHSYGPWLEQCKPANLAAMTVARVIQSCVRSRDEDHFTLKISTLSVALGTDIQDYLQADNRARRDAYLRKQRKITRRNLIDKLSKAQTSAETKPIEPILPTTSQAFSTVSSTKPTIPVAARTRIGALCLELLLQSAKLTVTVDNPETGESVTSSLAAFHHQMGFHAGKRIGYLVPHHDLVTKLRTTSVHGLQIVKLPMICEPKPWSSFEDGGYYTAPQRVVRQKSSDIAQRSYVEAAIENGDMDQILAGLDVLGKVPWQINAAVFAVMTEAWNAGEGLGGLVAEDHGFQRPQEPPADSSLQDRAKWGKALREYENLCNGHHSQRCFQNFQLETARAYVNEKKMFFPHSVDFRGRAYPVPPLLNHIGADVARGLLQFAHSKELGTVGLQWLKVHLANLYGFDKASLKEREQFSMDNIEEIYDSATNPLGGRRWWAKAEDPWQCLACCMELKNALDSPDPTCYKSQLPVHQDGTCNGLQHYAALGGDHVGARQVNLEPSDRPQDIYTGVAELVREMVTKDAEKGAPAACFVKDHITRKIVKRTVMTNVYGVTFMGAKQQVYEELQKVFPHFKETDKISSLYVVALYIARRIFEALGKIFNGAQEIQYWLGECGERITTSLTAEQVKKIQDRFEGLPLVPYDDQFKVPKKLSGSMVKKMNKSMETFRSSIIWTTPLKMPIVQPYRKDGIVKINTKIQDITVLRKTSFDVVDKRKQLQAFPPNFIHSLDATHMILSALKCSEMGLDFAAVHDSFWTHAADIPTLNTILRDAFVRMHSENIIDRLGAEFSARYAGAMYRATILSSSTAGVAINNWRSEHRKISATTPGAGRRARSGLASLEEVALESRRQELLQSKDPKDKKEGKKMVTPTSIWLAHQDPKSLASFRLQLIGETESKKSKMRQDEVKDKILSAEAEAVKTDASEEVARVESTVTVAEEAGTEDECKPAKKERSAARRLSDKTTIEVWIPLTFPPVPAKGTWDVSRLLESQYFFS